MNILTIIKLKWQLILIKIKKQIGLFLVIYAKILFGTILMYNHPIKIVYSLKIGYNQAVPIKNLLRIIGSLSGSKL